MTTFCDAANPMSVIYPRDAMLARYYLWPSVCLSVCLSQVGELSKRLDESRSFLVCRLASTYPTLCFEEIQVSTNVRIVPLWNLVLSTELGKFRHGTWITATGP